MLYPADLVLCFPEGAVLREAVFQIATNCTSLDGQSDRFTHFPRRVSITAFQIDRHRQLRRVGDPAKIIDREGERRVFTVRITTCLRNCPTAGSESFGACLRHSLGASRIPDVK